MSSGTIEGLFIRPDRKRPLVNSKAISLVAQKGIVGNVGFGELSPCHLLIANMESLADQGLPSGSLMENLSVIGLDIDSLKQGNLLGIGEAIVKLTYPNEPCKVICSSLKRNRGYHAVVIKGGEVRLGDVVYVIQQNWQCVPQTRFDKLKYIASQIPAGKVLPFNLLIVGIGGTRAHYRIIPVFIKRLLEENQMPLHRIVSTSGSILDYIPNQKRILESEGVTVRNGQVDIAAHAWRPNRSLY
jgi:alkylated DNA nucleotide flippase Atl1